MLINNSLFSLLPIKVSSQQRWPVAEVEDGEDDGKRDFADQFKLEWGKILISFSTLITFLLPLAFPARSEEDGDDDELKDTTEDKEHADEHPDVKEGDVGNTRNILSNLKELDVCQQNQMCYLPSWT